jgi:hypothetical protein
MLRPRRARAAAAYGVRKLDVRQPDAPIHRFAGETEFAHPTPIFDHGHTGVAPGHDDRPAESGVARKHGWIDALRRSVRCVFRPWRTWDSATYLAFPCSAL